MEFRASLQEIQRRREAVRRELEARDLNGIYVTSPAGVFYLTGFYMVSTERPAGLVLPLKGEPGFVGPRLEKDHVERSGCDIAVVRTYFDYPGERHPMEAIADFLTELGMSKGRLGTDNPAGHECRWGYQGPKLADLLPKVEFADLSGLLGRMRRIKSAEEIHFLRESCRWADRAMTRLVEHAAPGAWDVEVSLLATLEATRDMKAALGEPYFQAVHGDAPAAAGFRGQVGAGSAIPHVFSTNRRMAAADVLGAGASAEVGGYHCELERTLFLGPPSEENGRRFDIMRRAQQAALDAMRPGEPCSAADLAAYAVFEKEGVADRTLHHSGHGLGLDFHEPPFLDRGEETVLEPGMVFAVEPGIYFPGEGGFRHSDTVLVTESGAERLTGFPGDLEACTLPAP